MDNLTHTLAGAALGEAGLKHRTGLAMPTLLIGANLPDMDVVSILFGEALPFRRGWTHGVLAIVVLPLLLTAGMLAWDRYRRRRGRIPEHPVRPRQLLLLAYVAVLSHPLLDWLNTYGMRWLMPFDGRWFYGDALFIVDPWVWLALIVGVLAARRRYGARAGRITVAVVVVYATVMVGTSAFGRVIVEKGVRREGIEPESVMVGPIPGNPNRRQVVIDAAGVYYKGYLVWLPSPVLTIDEEIVVPNLDHPLAAVAARHPDARRFLRWSRYPFYVFDEEGPRVVARLDDLRYGTPERPSWAAVTVLLPVDPSRETPPLRVAGETGSAPIP
jgi:inner membrane protein